ncbi:MAG: threonine ammonia-lyase [Rhodospirillaceae bacterium]|nr:threonine ammonia-lyase [Rhodospirillaceae bacterium]MYF86740.1 threonine ammonia-lyase [Rhodospirillaceae bacterium]MYH38532.1 threonine ammonia-lyase [Rhodospirillaceae bacterium]MYK13486.1 threonine ammonia-lyase [Rhodospirillaceae bacterium]MYK60217.1 threonine ammonia-lyase [Rhodospirillaceae bacterium]
MTVTAQDIREAARLLDGQIVRTPTLHSRTLSEIAGCGIWLKFENLQYTASFKDRGAYVKLASLDDAARKAGVIAASAGNHAQGVAYHARRLGIPATIVMPAQTPFNKVRQTEHFGARIVLHGADLAESYDHALEIAPREGLTVVHPYDDPKIIAGQGTAALEMLEDAPDLDTLVVPIGGGGLIGGMALIASEMKPGIELFGAEAALYPAMKQCLAGEEIRTGGTTIAEGIAVKRPGEITREIVRRHVSEILLVDEPALEGAVLMLLEIEKSVVEGAGAAALAAVLQNRDRFAGRTVGVVVSGGNIDSRVLSAILMRGLVRDGRLVRLRIDIQDQPGVLGSVARLIGEAGGNIVEVYHQRLFHNVPLKQAELDIVVETRDADHVDAILKSLCEAGHPATMLSSATGAKVD